MAARYRVEGVLGAGGMGAVVAAVDARLGTAVAVKFLNPELAHEPEQISRFMREAQATSRIRTEHVVRVLDVGATPEGLHYIVMERLEGADLGDLVARGPLACQLAVDCILQAAEALAEAHAAGIVHRDIKPSNLWLAQRPDGSPMLKVLDFGISKLVSVASADPKLTETQAVFGSPTYMSPEQIRSAKNVDALTDVWALGVVLFELLTARSPFEGESVGALLASVSADAPIPLLRLRPEAPPEVASAIVGCLAKDRSRRLSLAELATRLRPYASAAGALSADRVARGRGAPSLFPAGAPPSAASSSEGALTALAGTQTDVALATTRLQLRGARWIIPLVLAVIGVLAVSGLLALRFLPSRATPPSGASGANGVALPSAPAISSSPAPSSSSNTAPFVLPEPASSVPSTAGTSSVPSRRPHHVVPAAPSSRGARPAEPVIAPPRASGTTIPPPGWPIAEQRE